MPAQALTVFSPAKLNLILKVLGRRPDGYHELLLLNTAIDLMDRVTVTVGGEGVRVECDHPGVPTGPSNLAARAAEVFFAAFPDRRTGLRIGIEKKIPVAGGLGGGSSNAAAVLWCLPRLLGVEVSAERLRALGSEVGSDVPFFLFRSPAWAEGRGERLREAPGLPPYSFVVVRFPFGLGAGEIFGGWDLTSGGNRYTLGSLMEGEPPPPRDWVNDLGPVVFARHGETLRVRDRLLSLGGLAALVSGSGPTVFGVFPDDASALRACNLVNRDLGFAAELRHAVPGPVMNNVLSKAGCKER